MGGPLSDPWLVFLCIWVRRYDSLDHFFLWLSSYPLTHEIEAGLQKPLNIHTQWEVVPKSLLHSHIAEVVKKTICCACCRVIVVFESILSKHFLHVKSAWSFSRIRLAQVPKISQLYNLKEMFWPQHSDSPWQKRMLSLVTTSFHLGAKNCWCRRCKRSIKILIR